MSDDRSGREILRRTVMIVDDEEVNRSILGNIVGQDYDVVFAENGIEAVHILKEKKDIISLVLLDLLMPKRSGYDVIVIMQNDDVLRKIPIIVLTSEREAEVESLELGAADFITKPYDNPKVILARINRSIKLSENSGIIQAVEHDQLTGLYTRKFFYEYANKYNLYRPATDMDAIAINFNSFHLVNEIYGRQFGDEMLQIIATRLRETLQDYDGYACRCSGDTFLLYIEHQQNYEELMLSLMDAFSTIPKSSRIRVRMGVYPSVDKSLDVQTIFDRATLACNTLRNNFTEFIAFFDEKLSEKEVHSAKLIADMDEAIEQKQFQVYYQPKYNIKGKKPKLTSAEALIRWEHPVFGWVSPGDFVPLFEENGLVQKLDRYVWQTAARQMKEWREKYGVVIPVSVNVSRIDIYDPNLKDDFLSLLEENELSTDTFMLEITESAYTDNSRQIVDVVEQLREEGFKVEMDDFGSGYSSLNMLTTLPIDVLKLDMAFVQNIHEGNKEYRMVELIMDIAKYLDVPVIAEGVENDEQFDLLKKAGCDVIQGYYFSKPVSPEEFEEHIKKSIKENK